MEIVQKNFIHNLYMAHMIFVCKMYEPMNEQTSYEFHY